MNNKKFKGGVIAAAVAAVLAATPVMADYRIVYPSGGAEKTEATAGLAVSLLSSEINGNTITLNYDKDLGSGPLANAFAVDVNGVGLSVDSANVSGSTLTLGLNAAVNGDATVTLTYSDPSADNDSAAIQSDSGTDAASFTQVLTNSSASAGAGPTFSSAAITGTTFTATFSEALAGNTPSTSSFSVAVNGADAQVASYSVSGAVFTVNLSATVTSTDTVTFSYTDNNPYIDDASAIQAADGRDAASIADASVTNNTPAAAAVVESVVFNNGSASQSIKITFNHQISTTLPKSSKFTFWVGGSNYGFPNNGISVGNTNGKGWVSLRFKYKQSAFNLANKHVKYDRYYSTGSKLFDSDTSMYINSFDAYE